MTVNNHIFTLILLGLVWIPFSIIPIAPALLIISSFVVGFVYSAILLIRRKELLMTSRQKKVITILFCYFSVLFTIFLKMYISPGWSPEGMPL